MKAPPRLERATHHDPLVVGWRAATLAAARALPGALGVYALIRRRLVPDAVFLQTLHLLRRLPPGSTVIDVGCGVGLFTLGLARLLPHLQFTGLELNAQRVQAAQAAAQQLGLPNARFLAADLRTPELAAGFQASLIVDLLHHLPLERAAGLLQSLAQSLPPEGLVVVKDIDTTPWLGWAFTYALDLLMAPHDCYGYASLAARAAQMEAAGFTVEAALPVASLLPYPHHLLWARRR